MALLGEYASQAEYGSLLTNGRIMLNPTFFYYTFLIMLALVHQVVVVVVVAEIDGESQPLSVSLFPHTAPTCI